MPTLFPSTITEIDEFLEWNLLKILYISSPNCTTCAALFPKIEKIISEKKFAEIAKIEITKIPEVAGKFGVFSWPTILVFHNKKEFARFDRYARTEIFEEKISSLQFLTEN